MSDEFLNALLDAIAPGGELPNGVIAPSGSAAGILGGLRIPLERHPAVQAVAGAGFLKAGTEARVGVLDRAQAADPVAFAGLITLVLSAYYQAPEVIEAFGWRADPPQPRGHPLPAFDESLLAPVRARGLIWRRP